MKLVVALLFVTLVRFANAQTVLTNTDALQAIYRGYDPATKTADGTSWHEKGAGVDRLRVDVILSVQVNTVSGGPRTYVVMSAVPQPSATGKYDCHACAPDIGVGIFVYANSSWRAESSSPSVASLGAWGGPPDADLVRIGPNLYGVRLTAGDMHQGDVTTFSELLAASGKSVSVIWKIMEREDNTGDYDSTGQSGTSDRSDFRSTYTFIPAAPATDHYQIEVVSRGWGYGLDDSFGSQNWNAIYRFKDGSYQLVKRTDFRELPIVKYPSKPKLPPTSLPSTQSRAPS
jgi:hypothetical protein